MIPLPDVTIDVLDLFVDDPLAYNFCKRCRTSDDDLDVARRDVERLERKRMKAA